MSVNRFRPHIFILPEDDANRQIENGFVLNIDSGQIQILTEAGGWTHVRDDFTSDHIRDMRQYSERVMVLLIDFDDGFPRRLKDVQDEIPNDLAD